MLKQAFKKGCLSNGLRYILYPVEDTSLVCVNMFYFVGSRDEEPDKTGFAHLFEHLMFAGSENVPSFDNEVESAGGVNNAFTTQDYTDYFIQLPADNIELALWLESDRMRHLNINERSLNIQKNVVIEEFKETHLNQPYGDLFHILSDLCFSKHSYRWPTIGLSPEHIEKATIEDVKLFYDKWYQPNNAILAISGKFQDNIEDLIKKYFEQIPSNIINERNYQLETPIDHQVRKIVKRDVPLNLIVIAFHMPGRLSPEYSTYDILSDILGNDNSSRLYTSLVKEKKLFISVDASLMGSVDPGLMLIMGIVKPSVDIKKAEAALWDELVNFSKKPITDRELDKVRNMYISSLSMDIYDLQKVGFELSFYEALGNAELLFENYKIYKSITKEDIMNLADRLFNPDRAFVLNYLKK
jgi:predicted Zn-dependent peptidase